MAYTIEKHHGEYNRVKRTQIVKYIVVHYVGSGTSKNGSALNNCKYFGDGNRGASAHYFIDDGSICEYADPKAYYTWHCGDGHGRYGITNANSIGIEVCIDGDVPFTSAEIDRLAWLVGKLMRDFGVSASNVVRHYDASRKMCPYYYAKRQGEWESLRKRITGASGGSSTPASKPSTKVKFPLPSNHWYGMPHSDNRNHSGYYNEYDRPAIKKIQAKVGTKQDGYFGALTSAAVKKWQKAHGLTADGLVGIKTWTKMFG